MATRPDIAHAAGMLGRYNSAPNEAHMTAAKRVCRYLKGTIDIKRVYTETVCEAVGYSDTRMLTGLAVSMIDIRQVEM